MNSFKIFKFKFKFKFTLLSLRELWDNVKHYNICIIGLPEEEKEDQGIENIFEEIINENFPNLMKEKDT